MLKTPIIMISSTNHFVPDMTIFKIDGFGKLGVFKSYDILQPMTSKEDKKTSSVFL